MDIHQNARLTPRGREALAKTVLLQGVTLNSAAAEFKVSARTVAKWVRRYQTEGPAGSARGGALAQSKNPTRRGVMVWVETDGTVYWAVADHLVTTHTDGADRNDNKYIDNGPTFHQVNANTSIGVEFAGNYPDVTRGATEAQIAAWRVLVKVLRARYGIPLDRVYAHNWIDFKDARYCEGCALATLARQWGE